MSSIIDRFLFQTFKRRFRQATHSLDGVRVVKVIVIGHVSLPWTCCPGAWLRVGVDGHLAAIRAKVPEVCWILGRRHWRSDPDWQAEETLHVDDFRPGDLATIVRQTAQCALIAGIYIWIIAYVRLLAESAHVAVGFL